MLDVCPSCGAFRDAPLVVGREVVCAGCGGRVGFRRSRLLLVGGPSGAGKSATLARLMGTRSDLVLLDADVLWSAADEAEPGDFFDRCLRVARDVGQSGHDVVLFGAGFAVPANVEPRPHRAWFTEVHYLALVADDRTIAARLDARPAWRQGPVEPQLSFARWLREQAPYHDPPIVLVDTTGAPVEETVAAVARWIDRVGYAAPGGEAEGR